jgi:hypothetical protein
VSVPPSLPRQIGPAAFDRIGKLIGAWEPGSQRWLIERRRIGPVIRQVRAITDPLSRNVGMSLD